MVPEDEQQYPDTYMGGIDRGPGRDSVKLCMAVDWPAAYLWRNHLSRQNSAYGARSWMGSLIQNKRDETGQLYMRNRFYDPQTGRFTQEDPIGLAGGLNAYGFANGDPVSYSDPYGLKATGSCCDDNPSPRNLELELRTFQWNGQHPRESALLGGLVLSGAAVSLWGTSAITSSAAEALLMRTSVGLLSRAGLIGAASNRLADAVNRSGGNPLVRITRAAQAVGQLGLRQSTATRLIETTIEKMGYDRGETVMVNGVNYILSATPGAVVRAVGVMQDGSVVNATIRTVNGVNQVVQ